MPKLKTKPRKGPRCRSRTPDGRRCPAPAFPGRTHCAQHIREKNRELRMRFSGKLPPPGVHHFTIDKVTHDSHGAPTAHVHIIEPPAPPAPTAERIRTFHTDHRATNPKLHNYYVREAYLDLKLARDAAGTLEDRARVSCTAMAGALRQAMREEIEDNAAFFEAAALLFAGLEPSKEVEP